MCLEIHHRCGDQLFASAYATMQTSGQSYVMAFAGSGANALDRGLKALAYAYKAMSDVSESAQWERSFGGDGAASLEKHYRRAPRGVAVLVAGERVPVADVQAALCEAVDFWLENPKRAATLCGTLFDPSVQDNVDHYRQLAGERVRRDSCREQRNA